MIWTWRAEFISFDDKNTFLHFFKDTYKDMNSKLVHYSINDTILIMLIDS